MGAYGDDAAHPADPDGPGESEPCEPRGDDLPYLPPAQPARPPAPVAPNLSSGPPAATSSPAPAAGADQLAFEHDDGDAGTDALPADRVATRNVPTIAPRGDADAPAATSTTADLDVPPPAPGAPSADPRAVLGLPTKKPSSEPFVPPELVSLGPSTSALLVGRGLMAVAALLVGLAARRATGAGAAERGEAFWPVVGSAGVFVAVAVAGLAFWSFAFADNGHRLEARRARPTVHAWLWAAPVGWVVFSALTYLRIDVDGELDPLPGVAAVGFAIALSVPYARLQGLFKQLSRRPPFVWIAYLIDLVAFGLVWWRLTDWPSPVAGGDADLVRRTANIAFAAAALLAANGLVFAWLAQRASQSVYERLGRLEARHRSDDDVRPAWFHSGMQVMARPAPVDTRALVPLRPLAVAVAGLHVLWGIAMVAFAVALARLAFDYSGEVPVLGEELELDDRDAERVGLAAGAVAVTYVITIVVHAVWGTLTALNARRVTVHAPNPASFGVLFAPMPVLVIAGLLVGGDVGYYLALAGLAFAFFALFVLNRMLMALSGRLGGALSGFGQWTALITAVYLVGVAENFLFSRAVGRLGFFAAATLLQGAFIIIGGVVGHRAMAALEATILNHRQARRVGPG